MKKVYIIHGFQAYPNGGWRPWLMRELVKHDIYACSLPMPSPDKPKQEEWIKLMQDIISPDESVFLVGHSLGSAAILRYLEKLEDKNKINGVILASGPIHPFDSERAQNFNNFLIEPFDYNHIKNVCDKFIVIHGDDDPNVPFSHAEELSKNLNCELVNVKEGKHLNGSAGFYELPILLEKLLVMLR